MVHAAGSTNRFVSRRRHATQDRSSLDVARGTRADAWSILTTPIADVGEAPHEALGRLASILWSLRFLCPPRTFRMETPSPVRPLVSRRWISADAEKLRSDDVLRRKFQPPVLYTCSVSPARPCGTISSPCRARRLRRHGIVLAAGSRRAERTGGLLPDSSVHGSHTVVILYETRIHRTPRRAAVLAAIS